jgi:opacity protein-like surface antigen
MRVWFATAALAIAVLGGPAIASAQGPLVHGSVAAAGSDDTTSPSFAGGVAYRFNRALGFGVELTHIDSLSSNFPHIFCCGDTKSRATIFTTNVRLEIPTTSSRVIPFVTAGGGVASVTQAYNVYYAALAAMAPLGLQVLPGPSTVETTTASMALTLGGGASFLLTDHVAVDADLRVLHLMDDQGRNVGRFGAGVSYRF